MKRISIIILLLIACVCSISLSAQSNRGTYGRGADKKEADDRISSLLENTTGSQMQVTSPALNLLKEVKDKNYFVMKGDTFMIEAVRSDSYYTLKGETPVAIFDTLHFQESISNLLLQKVDLSDMNIEVLYRKYGMYLPTYDVRWADLLTVLLDKGHRCYAAVQMAKKGNKATGVLVVDHPSRGYIHMLMLSINGKDLFTTKAGKGKGKSISGLLYTNVPYSNVLELFEERKK